jgi:predicted ATPase/DNA-binding XRE family transcriptional regulator
MNRDLSFGNWVKQRRKALDLTQADLARQVGCAAVTIRKIEVGRLRPSKEMIERLADHLGIPFEERGKFFRLARQLPHQTALRPHAAIHLPTPPTPLIGRFDEIQALYRLLSREDVRLVTLIGPPGIGKTRLSLEVAGILQDQLDQFADGVYFIALAGSTDSDHVALAIAQTIGVRERAGQPMLVSLKQALLEREILLLLDNFEQVLEARSLVAEVLAACSQLKILVTSRTPLHLRGEHEFPVPSLALPDQQRLSSLSRDTLTQCSAVALFIQRAQAVKSDFVVTEENARTVAKICARLDGLPLALELAAARIKLFSPQALLARLNNRLMLLTDGPLDLPVRQQTLRNAIAWSYDIMDPSMQTLFARLSVFVGSWTLDAAEAVCVAPTVPGVDVEEGLARLVNKSLVQQVTLQEESLDTTPRFMMLETIREYAQEQLAARTETEAIQRQHAEYYLKLTEQVAPQLKGPQQMQWLDRLDREQDNLRAAMAWLLSHGEWEPAVRFGWELWLFWWLRGRFTEGRHLMEQTLAGDNALSPSGRAKALFVAGTMATGQADYQSAAPMLQESLELFRALEDRYGAAHALGSFGLVAVGQQQHERATLLFEEAADLFLEIGHTWGASIMLSFSGAAWLHRGDSLRTQQLAEQALSLAQAIGDRQGISIALHTLTMVAQSEQDHKRATRLFTEGLILANQVGDESNIAYCLAGLALIAAAEGKYDRAAQLWGAAEALFEIIEATPYPHATDRSIQQNQMIVVRERLGEAAFASAWAKGRALTVAQAIAEALAVTKEKEMQ